VLHFHLFAINPVAVKSLMKATEAAAGHLQAR
jgi:hypothetical protein